MLHVLKSKSEETELNFSMFNFTDKKKMQEDQVHFISPSGGCALTGPGEGTL